MRATLLWVLLSLVSCALALATPAQAPDMSASGNSFMSECGGALDSQHISAAGAMCLTYVIGLHDGIGMFADKGGPAEVYCQPDGVTAGQALRLLAKYIKDHPEKSHHATRDLMLAALVEAFPCPMSPPEKKK